MKPYHTQLFEEKLLTHEQQQLLNKIDTEEMVSVYFETRSLLYVGVLLLTTGIGLLVYQNLGQIGHFALISLLILMEGICLFYIFSNALPFSTQEQNAPTPYFDYLVLLASLIIISIFTYIFIQFDLLEAYIKWSSLVSAAIFFFIAFRYDHKGVLTLAITAFTAFWGISISPVNWLSFNFDSGLSYYVSAIFIGLTFLSIGFVLEYKLIKRHFKFTFQNIGLILFYLGMIILEFDSSYWGIYSLITILISIGIGYYSWKQQEFIFFVYAVLGGYVSITHIIISALGDRPFGLWLMYFIFSMTGLITLINRISNAQRKTKKDDSL